MLSVKANERRYMTTAVTSWSVTPSRGKLELAHTRKDLHCSLLMASVLQHSLLGEQSFAPHPKLHVYCISQPRTPTPAWSINSRQTGTPATGCCSEKRGNVSTVSEI